MMVPVPLTNGHFKAILQVELINEKGLCPRTPE